MFAYAGMRKVGRWRYAAGPPLHSVKATGDRGLRGGHRSGLKLAHRRTQSPALTRGGVDPETLPHSVADAELQLRVRFRCVIGGRFEELVGQSQLEDCPEGLPVLPPQ